MNFNSVAVFSKKSEELVEFYKKVFQKDLDWNGGDFYEFKVGSRSIAIDPSFEIHGKNLNPNTLCLISK